MFATIAGKLINDVRRVDSERIRATLVVRRQVVTTGAHRDATSRTDARQRSSLLGDPNIRLRVALVTALATATKLSYVDPG